ncbi:NAD-dependent epimerase/dehydratase family protein [Bifidobacterium mongoliense]|uniref:dTDP-glucose 4,6-dehydratase n=1 Tax=Bifidobacterium mongoliense TaxID=518643 RepID=A0A423UFZ1_9BIFI|nr:NAD-dependent epimerase/dehydratase family protein [Bifidobacterium mongoliense]ROT87593.1 dTDP-glucose 4,6-dehydratase [Bifidobacterium mongoliense]
MNQRVKSMQSGKDLYQEDVEQTAQLAISWRALNHTNVLISGATGLLGTFLIDVLMYRNINQNFDCHILAVGRNETRARSRFCQYWGNPHFTFIQHDINASFNKKDLPETVDFIIHLASNTHPRAYASDPVTTIIDNVVGTNNLLSLGCSHDTSRFVFASSCEIYGENRGNTAYFHEDYCGYINSNTLRAGYPESKRCGEALCQAYHAQHGMGVVIPRFSRCYGPTVLINDSKASSQFFNDGLSGNNIALKSTGNQFYSYTYVSDAVSGLLYVLLQGDDGQEYNIADTSSDIHLRDFAKLVAEQCGVSVVFDNPDNTESAGFSKVTTALQDGSKLHGLGWTPIYSIENGISRTLAILESRRLPK